MGRQSRTKASRLPSVTEPAAVATPAARSHRLDRRHVFAAVGLVLLTLAVYAQVANHQFVNFDDPRYLYDNAIVQRGLTLEGIRWAATSMELTWHPVTYWSLMLDVELFGASSRASHLISVAYHIANTLLLFFLLVVVTGSYWRCATVAALFAIHPLHVESVAWVAERKDVVSTLFLLITVWLYVSWTRRPRASTYILMLLAFAAGMAAKQMLMTLPFALLLLDYWPLRRIELKDRALILERVLEKIPLFVVVAGGVVMSFAGQRALGAFAQNLSLGMRLTNAIASYGGYLWKTLIPVNLAMPYPYGPVSATTLVLSLLVLLMVTAAAIAYREAHRWLFMGWFWFVGTLVPVIGIIQIGGQSMADRYTYVPHIGLFIAAVWSVAELATKRKMQRVAAAVAVVAIVIFTIIAYGQVGVWRDTSTLFNNALAKTRRNFIAHLQLASAQFEKTELQGALTNFRTAHKLRSDSTEARNGLVNTLIELAKLDQARGNDAEAKAKLDEASAVATDERTRAAIALASRDTTKAIELYSAQVAKGGNADETAKAHNDLGAALASAGRDQEAVAEYQKAIAIAPRQFDARMNLGAILSRLERNDEAIEQFNAAASIRPESVEPHVYLALAYFLQKRHDETKVAAERAYAIDPHAANLKLTTAMRIPYKETNIQDFIAFVESKRQAQR